MLWFLGANHEQPRQKDDWTSPHRRTFSLPLRALLRRPLPFCLSAFVCSGLLCSPHPKRRCQLLHLVLDTQAGPCQDSCIPTGRWLLAIFLLAPPLIIGGWQGTMTGKANCVSQNPCSGVDASSTAACCSTLSGQHHEQGGPAMYIKIVPVAAGQEDKALSIRKHFNVASQVYLPKPSSTVERSNVSLFRNPTCPVLYLATTLFQRLKLTMPQAQAIVVLHLNLLQ